MVTHRYSRTLWTLSLVITLLALSSERGQAQISKPVADAGPSRYVATDPVQLNGTRSYAPGSTSPLGYTWRQIAGPTVSISDANSATPTISGFTQTDAIQECEFELRVSCDEVTSLADKVRVVIVPRFAFSGWSSSLMQNNPPFDPNKPTLVGFIGIGGASPCTSCGPWTFLVADCRPIWRNEVNIITFSNFNPCDYKTLADMLIVYLSDQAPNYRQSIQTLGYSAGGQPATDVAIYVNETYADGRYAVNRVTLLDATAYCREYQQSIDQFLGSAVDGEQCWIDSYVSTELGSHPLNVYPSLKNNVLNVWLDEATNPTLDWFSKHNLAADWYESSICNSDISLYRNGIVAGAYWSVAGPGKNLQLASTPGATTYSFTWYGDALSGHMDFYDEPNHPGRLPEPVTLIGPEDGAIVDADGAVFSCEISENAVGYQLLFGSDPYRVMDYIVISDTPNPPVETITEFPCEKTWWTVRAYDSFGSTIHADPHCVNALVVSPPMTPPDVLYIYNDDIEAAESFESLLMDCGCPTTLIRVADVPTTPLDSYDVVIVANDTQYETTWSDPNTVTAIEDSGKPIVGLGNGGYDFFGLLGLSIGNPMGGHSSQNSIKVVDPNCPLFSRPYSIEIPQDLALWLYTETNSIGIYLWPTIPETVTVFGSEADDIGYFPLLMEHDRYLLWGFAESPQKMTEVGKMLFINVVFGTANGAWED